MMQLDYSSNSFDLAGSRNSFSAFSPRTMTSNMSASATAASASTPKRRTTMISGSTPTASVTSPLGRNLTPSAALPPPPASFGQQHHHHHQRVNSSSAHHLFHHGGGTPTSHHSGVGGAHTPSSHNVSTMSSSTNALNFGDRFIPNRGQQDTNMSHYLLTSPQNEALPQQLMGVAGGANGGGTPSSHHGTIGGVGGSGMMAGFAQTNSVMEASSPAFAGSPNASPTRGNRNNQNRNPTGRSDDSAGVTNVGPQPYARSLAKVLFPEVSSSASVGGASGGASVLGFKTANHRPSSILVGDDASAGAACDGSDNANTDAIASPLLGGSGGGNAMMMGGRKSQSDLFRRSQGVVYQENRARNFQSKSFRVIPQTPERILDAPELLDDFYLNLLDWSSSNHLAVALGPTAYLWNADDGSIKQLMTAPQRDNIITAVSWMSGNTGNASSSNHSGTLGGGPLAMDGGDGFSNTIAVGLNDGTVQLWDAETQQLVRTINGHGARVCSLSWNGSLLASGSRDTTIRMHDMRDPLLTGTVQGHSQEVCGLRWSPNGGAQLASGGNDNLLNIWDFRRSSMEVVPLWQLREHTAAVKALAWNPRQPNLLVSGGGTADKTLRFWDTSKGECVNMVDTLSQVCGVMWNHDGTELVSSHGYSDNQLTLWKYPSLKRLADLTGHTSRVLHLSMSPDGQTVVSAAGDETIRFWRCFAPDSASTAAAAASNPFLFSSPYQGGGYAYGMSAGGCHGSPKREREAASPIGSPLGNGGFGGFDDFGSSLLR